MPRAICLKSRPEADASVENFVAQEIADAAPGDGDVVIETRYISVDPYLRGRMNDGESYVAPFALNEPIESSCVGKVVASNSPDLAAGDIISGYLPWQDRIVAPADSVQKIDTDGVSMTAYLGILGMPGQTAWVGLKGIGDPQVGETVFVSAASGAVGSTVGQIARQLGCRVVGSAGTDDKCAFVMDELGFDGAMNYRTETDLDGALNRLCPDGIDVNYENAGGPVSDAVFKQLNTHARMIICGLISRYEDAGMVPGPSLMPVLVKSIRIQGFIVTNYPDLCAEWKQVGAGWLREGKLKYRESIVDGLENAPAALLDVLAGRNFGKHLVKV
jgi:NADPH:quinone reductase